MLLKETALVRLLGLKIPVLLFLGPRVERLDEDACEVVIPFGWRSRNHAGVMYMGALVAGADLATGLPAARLILSSHRKVELLFTEMKAEFLKRADSDVHFRSSQVREVTAAVRRAEETGERVTVPIEIVATCPRTRGPEPVARFTLWITFKKRGEKPAEEAFRPAAQAR
jgi:acyl-coenzyme A thioesterase PaaI-like protein